MENLKVAQDLKINLYREGKKKVDLTFKAQTARWMLELLPSHLIAKISARGIDLEAIQQNLASEEELYPKELVRFADAEIEVIIWLQ